ncbi:hypothetical protein [Rhodococcus sp. T9N]|nr:hypothetical protein [Rhodococcus sp. T9N]
MNTSAPDHTPRPDSYTEKIHRKLFSDFQEPPTALTESQARR